MKTNLQYAFNQCFVFFIASSTLLFLFVLPQASHGIVSLIYKILAPINQAFVISLLLQLVLLPMIWLPKGLFKWFSAIVTGGAYFFILLDHSVFQLYRFHIDSFFLSMFFSDFSGFGFSVFTLSVIGIGLVCLPLIMRFVAPLLFRFIQRGFAIMLMLLTLLSLPVGQGIHAFAYAHNMAAILQYTPSIPWYAPLTANRQIAQWGLVFEQLKEENLKLAQPSGHFTYPLQPLNCQSANTPNIIIVVLESWRFDAINPEITPNIWQISEQGLRFDEHLSGGNVTTKGLFSLLYGLSPVYWSDALTANGDAALISELKQRQYEFYLLPNQDINRTGIKDLMFKDIENLSGRSPRDSVKGDQRISQLFIEQLQQRKTEQPFFSFLLYNSTHHSYYSPEDAANPFQPAKPIEMSLLNNDTQASVYLNQYHNATHFIDSEVAKIKEALIDQQLWDKSIVVITSDHGEEFNDQQHNFWGHGSNFSRYQMQVPLVIHWPGKTPQIFKHRSSHLDVAASILQDAFECQQAVELASNGVSLFDDSARFMMVSNYVHNGIIWKERVEDIKPGYVESYHFNDKNLPLTQDRQGLFEHTQQVQSKFRKAQP